LVPGVEPAAPHRRADTSRDAGKQNRRQLRRDSEFCNTFGGKAAVVMPLPDRQIMTQVYGPAVRCKLNLLSGSDWSCSSVSGPFLERTAPGHHGYPRASDLIRVKALKGR
jgi:hypothetical protein